MARVTDEQEIRPGRAQEADRKPDVRQGPARDKTRPEPPGSRLPYLVSRVAPELEVALAYVHAARPETGHQDPVARIVRVVGPPVTDGHLQACSRVPEGAPRVFLLTFREK